MSIATIQAALEKTAGMIGSDPAKARSKGTPASARLVDGLRFEITGPNGEKAHTDMPPPMGGTASAPNPGWLLRAALASCTGTVIAMRAAREGIALGVLELAIDSESDHRGLLGLDERVSAGSLGMRVRVKIGAKGVDAARLRSLVEWGDAHSPVACTLRERPPVVMEVEVV